jgi:hypothetical protein
MSQRQHLFVNLQAGNVVVTTPNGDMRPVRPWVRRPRSYGENIDRLIADGFIVEGEHYAAGVELGKGPLYPFPDDFFVAEASTSPETHAAEATDTPDSDVPEPGATEEAVAEVDTPPTSRRKAGRRKVASKPKPVTTDDAEVENRDDLIKNLSDDSGDE